MLLTKIKKLWTEALSSILKLSFNLSNKISSIISIYISISDSVFHTSFHFMKTSNQLRMHLTLGCFSFNTTAKFSWRKFIDSIQLKQKMRLNKDEIY